MGEEGIHLALQGIQLAVQIVQPAAVILQGQHRLQLTGHTAHLLAALDRAAVGAAVQIAGSTANDPAHVAAYTGVTDSAGVLTAL